MPMPKIMFVYQGSMDASTKETFEAGRFSFNHISWIEVMLNELKEGDSIGILKSSWSTT